MKGDRGRQYVQTSIVTWGLRDDPPAWEAVTERAASELRSMIRAAGYGTLSELRTDEEPLWANPRGSSSDDDLGLLTEGQALLAGVKTHLTTPTAYAVRFAMWGAP